jgi:hypothetical protein
LRETGDFPGIGMMPRHHQGEPSLARDTEQLELALETLGTDQAERLATASPAIATAVAGYQSTSDIRAER